jgi:hypothetical protein
MSMSQMKLFPPFIYHYSPSICKLCVSEVELLPGFVDDDGDGVGEIEAAGAGDHRQRVEAVGPFFSEIGREAASFRAEDEQVVGGVGDVGVDWLGVAGEKVERMRGVFEIGSEVVDFENVNPFPIIEAGAFELPARCAESQRAHEDQFVSRH